MACEEGVLVMDMRGACLPSEFARLRGLGRTGLWLAGTAGDFSDQTPSLASSIVPRSVDAIEGGALAKDAFFSHREVCGDLGIEVNAPDDALRRVFSQISNLANWMKSQLVPTIMVGSYRNESMDKADASSGSNTCTASFFSFMSLLMHSPHHTQATTTTTGRNTPPAAPPAIGAMGMGYFVCDSVRSEVSCSQSLGTCCERITACVLFV